jgi:hypothetical protein
LSSDPAMTARKGASGAHARLPLSFNRRKWVPSSVRLVMYWLGKLENGAGEPWSSGAFRCR